MLSHVVVGTNNLEKAKRFYDAVLGVLGHGEGVRFLRGDHVYLAYNGLFLVTRPVNGQPATPANGCTIGFACQSCDEVDLWHAEGVANGGHSIEDPPGVRHVANAEFYLAYLRDPDGNKLCARHKIPD